MKHKRAVVSPANKVRQLYPLQDENLKPVAAAWHALCIYDETYRNILPSEFYRIFIDAERWHDETSLKTRDARFDQREPGYMKAISTAFVKMVDIVLNNERNITAADLERIHYLAVDGVKDSRINEDLRGGYRDRKVSTDKEAFGLDPNSHNDQGTSSEVGRKEFLSFWNAFNKRHIDPDTNEGVLAGYFKLEGNPDKKPVKMNKKIVKALNDEIKNEIVRRESSQNQKAANGHGLVSSQLPTANEIHNRHRHLTSKQAVSVRSYLYNHFNPEQHMLKCYASSSDHLETVINHLLDEYYAQISTAADDDHKISIIVNLCQRLDQIHPFYDGNIRVFGMLVQLLCVKNGLRLPTFYDPNVLDMRSNAELVDIVKRAQQRTKDWLIKTHTSVREMLECVEREGSKGEEAYSSPQRHERDLKRTDPRSDRKKGGKSQGGRGPLNEPAEKDNGQDSIFGQMPRLNRHEFPDLRDSHLSCDVPWGAPKDAQPGVSAEKNSD